MRRSLASHAAARLYRAERAQQADEHLSLIKQTLRLTFPPADTALLQRAARAERQARTWYRLSIALAVGWAVLLIL